MVNFDEVKSGGAILHTSTPANIGPSGIGGWLIFPLIGVILSPLVVISSTYVEYRKIFSDGTWEVLTTPGSQHYHLLWAPMMSFELSSAVVLVGFQALLIYLFVNKSYLLPRMYIVYLLGNLAFVIAGMFLMSLIPAIDFSKNPDIVRDATRAFVSVCVWVPYFLVSKRVKNTFAARHGGERRGA